MEREREVDIGFTWFHYIKFYQHVKITILEYYPIFRPFCDQMLRAEKSITSFNETSIEFGDFQLAMFHDTRGTSSNNPIGYSWDFV